MQTNLLGRTATYKPPEWWLKEITGEIVSSRFEQGGTSYCFGIHIPDVTILTIKDGNGKLHEVNSLYCAIY